MTSVNCACKRIKHETDRRFMFSEDAGGQTALRVRSIEVMIDLVKTFPEHIRDIGDFEFVKKIGKGGFGEVWLAHDLRTGRSVAVKEIYLSKLTERGLVMFHREVQMMASLAERFIIPFVGFTVDPPYSIITEYMPNGALIEYIDKRTRKFALSGTHMSIIAVSLAWALLSLSLRQIVHRDVKCDNVLLDERWLPNLCDFGIARCVAKDRRMSNGCGTVTHMAPEVMRNGHPYGVECDVYSYGVMLYEMLDGHRAWTGHTKPEIKEAVGLNGKRPEFLSNKSKLPKPLVELIMECWDEDVRKRPTFKDIIDRFRKGQVFFPGTDTDRVKEFVQALIRQKKEQQEADIGDEQVNSRRKEVIVARLEDTLERAKREADHADVSAANEASSLQKLMLEDGTPAKNVLMDPLNPEFEEALDYCAHTMDVSHFEEFYDLTIGALKETGNGAITVMRAYTKLAKRDMSFISALNSVHFGTRLAVVDPQMRKLTFDYIEFLFCQAPSLIRPDTYRVISAFLIHCPARALANFGRYAMSYDEIDDPTQLLDLLIRFARNFLERKEGEVYIDIFHYLLTTKPTFREKRLKYLRPIICAFIRSSIPTVAERAICLVCLTYDSEFHIPFRTLSQMMKGNNQMARLALSLFVRVENLPFSKTLVRIFADKSVLMPRCLLVLQKYAAESVDKAEHVAMRQTWMRSESFEALRLFLILFAWEDLREKLIRSASFPRFMSFWARSKKTLPLSTFGALFSQFRVDQSMISDLSKAGFFANLLVSVENIDTNKIEVLHEIMVVLDNVARGGYSPDFLQFASFVVKFLPCKNALTVDAIQILTLFSRCHQFSGILSTPKLVQYFQALKSSPSFARQASIFLENVCSHPDNL